MESRQVVILRHGKASQDSPSGLDADRPLLGRGVRQAAWMGGELARAGFADAVVVSSPAVRTRHTAEVVAGALGSVAESDDRLFLHGTVGSVLDALTEHLGRRRVVLVGHNPTFSLVASVLTHGVGPCAISLRTGEAAICEMTGEVEPGCASLLGVWRSSEK